MQELAAIQPTPGPVLAAERQRLGISQAAVARQMGLHRTRLHVWEKAAEVAPVKAARYIRALREIVAEEGAA